MVPPVRCVSSSAASFASGGGGGVSGGSGGGGDGGGDGSEGGNPKVGGAAGASSDVSALSSDVIILDVRVNLSQFNVCLVIMELTWKNILTCKNVFIIV